MSVTTSVRQAAAHKVVLLSCRHEGAYAKCQREEMVEQLLYSAVVSLRVASVLQSMLGEGPASAHQVSRHPADATNGWNHRFVDKHVHLAKLLGKFLVALDRQSKCVADFDVIGRIFHQFCFILQYLSGLSSS